jgi:hypothetical protein
MSDGGRVVSLEPWPPPRLALLGTPPLIFRGGAGGWGPWKAGRGWRLDPPGAERAIRNAQREPPHHSSRRTSRFDSFRFSRLAWLSSFFSKSLISTSPATNPPMCAQKATPPRAAAAASPSTAIPS